MSCNHSRIIRVSGKTSDLCFVSYEDQEHDGYVPSGLGIGRGDYLEFDYCADCGKILDDVFPIKDINLED